jgi:hypothetical protein
MAVVVTGRTQNILKVALADEAAAKEIIAKLNQLSLVAMDTPAGRAIMGEPPAEVEAAAKAIAEAKSRSAASAVAQGVDASPPDASLPPGPPVDPGSASEKGDGGEKDKEPGDGKEPDKGKEEEHHPHGRGHGKHK